MRAMRLILPLLLLAACGAAETNAANAPGAAAPAAAPRFPKPDRPVAEIISPIWASPEERDSVREAQQVVRGLGITRGMAVADVGAGSGYHTVRLSPVVGPTGRVYAQDIIDEYLTELRTEIDRRKLANVTVVKGTAEDPMLPAASIDRAILVHMYHEIEQPYGLMWRLAASLKPGGKVGVIDLDRTTDRHGTPPALLRCEIEAVGYRQTGFVTLQGNIGYMAIFEPPARRPEPAAIRACSAAELGATR